MVGFRCFYGERQSAVFQRSILGPQCKMQSAALDIRNTPLKTLFSKNVLQTNILAKLPRQFFFGLYDESSHTPRHMPILVDNSTRQCAYTAGQCCLPEWLFRVVHGNTTCHSIIVSTTIFCPLVNCLAQSVVDAMDAKPFRQFLGNTKEFTNAIELSNVAAFSRPTQDFSFFYMGLCHHLHSRCTIAHFHPQHAKLQACTTP